MIQASLLSAFSAIQHGFTTRMKEQSFGEYQGLNLAFHVQDNEEDVLKNHHLLACKMSYSQEKLIHMKQIHSNDVHLITEQDCFETPPTCDALITNIKQKMLMVMVADCTPVLLYDPSSNSIGVAHVGRAGAFNNILKNVIKRMQEEFGANTQEMRIVLGPSIKSCCYKVGAEIFEQASELGYAFALSKRGEKYVLDVNSIIFHQLHELCIDIQHIEDLNICTSCHTEQFFSYRAEGKTGRFAGMLMLR